MTYKEKLQKRFEEMDKKPHINYRMIAFQLWLDYHKLNGKYEKLQKENESLKAQLKEAKEFLHWNFSF